MSCGLLLLHNATKLPVDPDSSRLLMVRRKDSMSYMEFIRGKYDPTEIMYVCQLFENMTIPEQTVILNETFETLWTKLWGPGRDQHSVEYESAKTKFESLDKKAIISLVPSKYAEPEWGFPKGRRMRGESDLDCATREFYEETNIPRNAYTVCTNLIFSETFTGTNGIHYKHVYFVALLTDPSLVNIKQKLTVTQRREVSAVAWKTFDECRQVTRPHYTERKSMLADIERAIQTFETLDPR